MCRVDVITQIPAQTTNPENKDYPVFSSLQLSNILSTQDASNSLYADTDGSLSVS
jgi:hypothetical protein